MRIILWGGRSKARIILEMIEEMYKGKAEVIGVFDMTLQNIPFKTNVTLYSNKSDLDYLYKNSTHYVVCIGGENGFARFETANKIEKNGLKPLSLISEYGLLDKLDFCGEGVQVMPGAIVHKFSSIGRQCIFNTNSTVDHECNLGDGVHIMGGASIAGRVIIGDFSTIGTNATVLPNIKIGKNVFVGAGAVVTKNIDDNTVVAGVPAKAIRKQALSFDSSAFE